MDPVARALIVGAGTPESAWQAWDALHALPELQPEELVPAGSRAVIVAPHPDDEILGTGGLIGQLAALGREIVVLAVTDGTASHAGSRAWPPERLARVRPAETREALRRLQAGKLRIMRAGLPDGRVAEHEAALDALLGACLWPTDVVFATWRHDGHPDHEAVGRAAARAAQQCGATLVEVPVWTWHWADPNDARVPWKRARRVMLDADARARKAMAVDAFASQIFPDQSVEADAVLPPSTLNRLVRQFEVFLI